MQENTRNFLKSTAIGLVTIAAVSLISKLPLEKNPKLAIMLIVGFIGLAIAGRVRYGGGRYPSIMVNELSKN